MKTKSKTFREFGDRFDVVIDTIRFGLYGKGRKIGTVDVSFSYKGTMVEVDDVILNMSKHNESMFVQNLYDYVEKKAEYDTEFYLAGKSDFKEMVESILSSPEDLFDYLKEELFLSPIQIER